MTHTLTSKILAANVMTRSVRHAGSATVALAMLACGGTPGAAMTDEPSSVGDPMPSEEPPAPMASTEPTSTPEEPSDPDAAELDRNEQSCKANEGQGCLQAGFMYAKGKGTDVDTEMAMKLFDRGCALGDITSCRNMGIVLAQGKWVDKDEDKAKVFFAKACKAGDAQSCDFHKELDQPAAASVAGANLNIGAMSADGMTARDLSCKVDGLGFLGGILLVGALAKRKAQLDRCAPNGATPSVEWTFSGNRVTKAIASGESTAVNSCVGKAMTGMTMPGNGECVATLVIGK